MALASKGLKDLKTAASGKNAFGLGDIQEAIKGTDKAMASLLSTGGKFGVNFGKNLKAGLKDALKEFKEKAGAIRLDVKTVDTSRRNKTRNSETKALEDNTKALNKHARAVEHFGFTDFVSGKSRTLGFEILW